VCSPTAAFLIGANVKVKLKASWHGSISPFLFFSPNEERSTTALFLNDGILKEEKVTERGAEPCLSVYKHEQRRMNRKSVRFTS